MQVKLNSNLQAKTIDELKQTRQSICLEFAYELCKEAKQLLHEADNQVISSDELEIQFKDLINKTRHPKIRNVQCSECVDSRPRQIPHIMCPFAIYFNDPHIFDLQMKQTFSCWKHMMLKAAIKLQDHAEKILCRQIDDPEGESAQSGKSIPFSCFAPM